MEELASLDITKLDNLYNYISQKKEEIIDKLDTFKDIIIEKRREKIYKESIDHLQQHIDSNKFVCIPHISSMSDINNNIYNAYCVKEVCAKLDNRSAEKYKKYYGQDIDLPNNYNDFYEVLCTVDDVNIGVYGEYIDIIGRRKLIFDENGLVYMKFNIKFRYILTRKS
ncbi:Hypothetical protein ORPV_723 [Orpheovirus IHUMI-LCC2]|uniref:Uncharacterized protein n=1 Tax=Orpheovirus IHUMI-LCC2 TaxID=2023057 RepID=A0A2I2L525_9VIRU|nr:Hypothetical protein ORPV_723 [Orpheovirus IHUMI-LCC2]SNW62627.1 Hypothetical protein ORPV_723 [Orpheovirus IHUMI-LCC2]